MLNVHECYRPEISSNNCDKVKEDAKNECINNRMLKANAKSRCESINWTALNSIRSNFANVIANGPKGTLYHELWHLAGLDDEFNTLGEHDNLMRGSNNRNARLYPR